jgi:kinetochore protein NDC80
MLILRTHIKQVLPQARLHYLESGHPTLQESAEVPEVFDDPNHHQALAFDYYTEAYGFFLDGADAFEDQDQILESRYGTSRHNQIRDFSPYVLYCIAKKNESVIADLEEQKTRLHQTKAEYDKIMSSGVSL